MALTVVLAALLGACGSHATTTGSPTSRADKLIQQGVTAGAAGDNASAVFDFNAALKLDPVSAVGYYDLGVAYTDLHNDTAARNSFEKALLIDQNYRSALFDLAILDTPSEPATAVQLYEHLIRLDPRSPNSLFNLGLLLEQLGHKTAGAADLAKAVAIDPALRSRFGKTTTTTTPKTKRKTKSSSATTVPAS